MSGINFEKIGVLDKGYVQLVDMMPSPTTGVSAEEAVIAAARASNGGSSKGYIKDRKLLEYLLKNKHTSPFEQVIFKFKIYAPTVAFWQWVRHRTWSFNFSSQRYLDVKEDDFYLPTQWRLQSLTNKQASDGILNKEDSDRLTELLSTHYDMAFEAYEKALSLGVAREQARFFLPAWINYYTCIGTIDAHNLIGFLKLRTPNEAQLEIREYARAIYLGIFKDAMPITSQYLEDEGVIKL